MNTHRIKAAVTTLSLPLVFVLWLATPTPADDLPPGQADLDRATEVHFDANTMRDFERVVSLCDSALEKGLDEPGTVFAKELASSTLFRRASTIFRGMRRGNIRNADELIRYRQLALADLEKAVDYKPDFVDAHLLICELSLLPGGDPDKDRKRGFQSATKAVEVLEAEAGNKAKLSAAYLRRGQLGDDLDQQLADFRKAAELAPTSTEILKQQAEFLHDKSQYEEAVKTLRKLVKASPDDMNLRLALAESLSRTGDEGIDEALNVLGEVLEEMPQSSEAYRMRAQLYIEQDQNDKAIEDLSKAIQINRNDLGARLFRAEIYLFEEQLKEARQDVDYVLARTQRLPYGIQLRSRISAAEGDLKEAMEDIRSLIADDPENADYRLQLAAYLNAAQRPRAAIEEITKVVENEPENWRALRARGDAYLSVGKHAEAIADYETALKMMPENSGILNNFAWVLATSPDEDVRNGKRAIELATKACEVTGYKEAHILSTLASGYAEVGDFETAIKWSEKSVELAEGEMVDQLKKELKSYQEKKPWREKQVVEEKEGDESPKKNLIDT